MSNSTLPHCVFVYFCDLSSKDDTLVDARVLTPYEFSLPKYRDYGWRAYSPDGSGPMDAQFKAEVDKYGFEAALFDTLSNCCGAIPKGVLQRLQVDLRRFRINGWTLEVGYHFDKAHKEMIEAAQYVA